MSFFAPILLFFSFSLFAQTTVTTQVSDIDTGQLNEETLIFLTSGQVAKISQADLPTIEELHRAKNENSWLEVQLNENREILSIKAVAAPYRPSPQSFTKYLENYIPSVISSHEEAQRLFRESRVKHKESQCYNRAHVWTYEWRAKNDLYTSKIWLFFTRKYIRKFNFEWWFHVSPYFHVQDDDKIWERIVDVKYAKGPLKLKIWTDIFLRNDADCPVVDSYSKWANYPETGWCYVMKTPMYYYQPLDMETLEKDGVDRHVWDPNEVRQAYKEAFDIDV